MANSIDTDVIQDGQLVRSVIVQEGTVLKSGGKIDTKSLVQTSDGAQLCDNVYIVGGGGGGSSLPSQEGHSGEFLTTDGTNASWATVPSGGGGSITTTWYTGNTGNSITISDTSSATSVSVFKNGVLLQPTEDYSISGTTLTLVTALIADDKITVQAEFGAHDATSGATVTSSWHSGTEWYRIWSDGWCEQGGYLPCSTDGWKTVNFHIPFVDTMYNAQCTKEVSNNNWISNYSSWVASHYQKIDNASFRIYMQDTTCFKGASWEAKGYIS